MVCTAVNRNTTSCLIFDCFKDLAIGIVIECVKLSGRSQWKQTMHAVVDQMIDHLTQYWIVYFSVICKWCDDWWNNSSWYKSHCFFLLVVAIFFGLNDLVICFNFCSLILDKELCDKQFQYTNARHDHRYGRLASNLVFQFCQSEHSVEYPESTVIEVGE